MEQENQKEQNLWVTHVSAIGPYLKICGQLDPIHDFAQRLKEVLLPSCKEIHNYWSIAEKKEHLTVGRIYLAKRMNRVTSLGESELLRARVTRLIETQPPQIILLVEVDFIDMGYRKIVECEELLIAPLNHNLVRLPALGSEFILLGLFAGFTSFQLEDILRLIARQNVRINVETEIEGKKFIKLQWKGWDLATFLITQRKIGSPIDLKLQRDNFLTVLRDHGMNDTTISSNMTNRNNHNNNDTPKHKNNFKIKRHSQTPNANILRYNGGSNVTSPLDEAKTIMHKLQQEEHKRFLREQLLQEEKQSFDITNRIVQMQLHQPMTPLTKAANRCSVNKIHRFRVGCSYDVLVSAVESGPYLFSVQLLSAQHQITEMTNEIERISLRNISKDLTPGMACIARYSEDGQLYRALIINSEANESEVLFMDYGNFDRIKKSDLYEMPSKLMDQRAFAFPFALAGLKSIEPIGDSLKKKFEDMVLSQTCKLKVIQAEGPQILQYCELHIENTNILDVLRKTKKPHCTYPKAGSLTSNDIVEIRFIDTPRSFFVQNVDNMNEFELLMDDMFTYYNSNQIVPEQLEIGQAYMVKTDSDWYRAEVLHAKEEHIMVRYVDYGFERTVTKNMLSTIAEKHLKLPIQAVHCCLKAFEDNDLNNNGLATTQFEMLAEDSHAKSRRSFNVRVLNIQPDGLHIVHLWNKSLNVSKTLLQLSMPREKYLSLKKPNFNMNECSADGNNWRQIRMKNAQNSLTDFNSLCQKQNEANTENSPRSQNIAKDDNSPRSQNIAKDDNSRSERESINSDNGVVKISAAIGNVATKIEYTTLDYAFPQDELTIPSTEEVTICWWSSPHQFFTYRKSREADFSNLMRDIQSFYKDKPLLQLLLKSGSYIIARRRDNNMFCRARIIDCNPTRRIYTVHFVDYGIQYAVTVDDIWPVECRFADFPIMGNYCSLKNIVSTYDHLYILDRIDTFLPNGAKIICEYKQRSDNLYYVNAWVNDISLCATLIHNNFVKEISPDIHIDLLVGQQICAKIVSIKNILNFKIVIEGLDVPLLSSFDNERLFNSNPFIVYQFKKDYEGKYCIVNIKEVNDNNVILLRPVFPLFKAEPILHICHYPRISYTFKASVVFIQSPSRIFVHQQMIEEKMDILLNDMYDYYEYEGAPLSSCAVGEFCAAKSDIDSNWYRARITEPKSDTNTIDGVEVYYIDYGNTENLKKTQLKKLEKRFYQGQSAYATEINLPLRLASSNASPKRLQEKSTAVLKEFKYCLTDKTIEVNVIECRRNHLVAEIITEDEQNIVDKLIEKKLVKGRDISHICKQLDNDKSSIVEFVEIVDLTLDTEDEINEEAEQEKPISRKLSTQFDKMKLNTSRNSLEAKYRNDAK